MSTIVVICIALLGILLFALGANVTRHRAIRGKSGGNQQPTAPDDVMLVAIRAHGNATEYVPTLIALLLVCSTLTEGWWLDALAIAATVARFAHAFGMLGSRSLAVRSAPKEAGAVLTYLTGIALGVTAIVAL
jgi:uncharacterized membrane protein YecN with MAPEG domain